MKHLILMTLVLIILGNNLSFGQSDEDDFDQLIEGEKRRMASVDNSLRTSSGDAFDLNHVMIDVALDPGVNYIKGNISSSFTVESPSLGTICFDLADNMIVDSVEYHNVLISSGFVTHTGGEVCIGLPLQIGQGTMDSIKIFYQGAPMSTGFTSFKVDMECEDPVLWTLSEPFGSKDWWPSKISLNDKIDSIDIIVTTPSNYKVASNGLLISNVIMGSDIVYHWKHNYPIESYLIAIAIADYSVYSDFVTFASGEILEIQNYIYSCDLATAEASLGFTKDAMLLFNDLFGNYPFAEEKYGHASCTFGGGMEHQTMSFMGGYGELLVSHELAHQWFGDKITCGTWQDIWLNEGWATYSEGMTHEHGIRSGSTTWTGWLQSKINNITNYSSGSVFVPNADAMNVNRIFNSRLTYNKGAMLLHMLRWKIGDDNFFAATNNYLTDTDLAYDYALTDHFKEHLEIESGLDLTEFFNDWYYGEGWPTYDFTWSQTVTNDIELTMYQSQSHASVSFFDIPIPLRFSDGTNDTIIVLEPSYNGEIFTFPIDFQITSMEFDPENWILAKSSVALPLELLSFIGNYGDEVVDLEWECNQLIDIEYFEIERSLNGIDFLSIEKINLENNQVSIFGFKDTNVEKEVGHYFYRLKSFHFDGSFIYSNVIKVDIDKIDQYYKLLTNPVIDHITLAVHNDSQMSLTYAIYNIQGVILQSKQVYLDKNQSILNINISHFPKGLYYLQINNSDDYINKEIIKL